MKRVLVLFIIIFLSLVLKAHANCSLKITSVGGVETPPVCLADPLTPDVVLDESLEGEVKIDVSADGIPDGTKIKVKIKDEDNTNAPSEALTDGMVTIPLFVQAGKPKILYVESDPFISTDPISPKTIPGLKLWLKADEGLLSDSAAQFVSLMNQFLYSPFKPSLQVGDKDFTISGWVYLDNKDTSQPIITKYATNHAAKEFYLIYRNTADRFEFGNYGGGGSLEVGQVRANNFGSPQAGKWYFIVAWYDSVNNKLGIQINNSTPDVINTTNKGGYSYLGLTIGGIGDPSPFSFFDGKIQSAAVWNRVLTSNERGYLYNNGVAKLYEDLSFPDIKTNLISWWNLTESSGTRLDSHSSNHLIDNNEVTAGGGNYVIDARDISTVAKWKDYSGNSNDFFQYAYQKRPTLKTGIISEKPVVRFDGIDDFLSVLSSPISPDKTYSAFFVDKPDTTSSGIISSISGNGELLSIGLNSQTSGLGLSGDVAEILVFDGELLPDDKKEVEYYLRIKYGL